MAWTALIWRRQRLDHLIIEAGAALPGEGLAGELEQGAAVGGHQASPTLNRAKRTIVAPGTAARSCLTVFDSSLMKFCSTSARSVANLRTLPSMILALNRLGLSFGGDLLLGDPPFALEQLGRDVVDRHGERIGGGHVQRDLAGQPERLGTAGPLHLDQHTDLRVEVAILADQPDRTWRSA